jgi:hypothetical protein
MKRVGSVNFKMPAIITVKPIGGANPYKTAAVLCYAINDIA